MKKSDMLEKMSFAVELLQYVKPFHELQQLLYINCN